MNSILKYAAAATLAGAMALSAVTPGEARGGRNAAIIGFGAGAIAGAAIAGSAYNNGYYAPGYAYGGGYYAEPDYAYEPAPVYVRPAPRPYYRSSYGAPNGCWVATDTSRGYGYYGAC